MCIQQAEAEDIREPSAIGFSNSPITTLGGIMRIEVLAFTSAILLALSASAADSPYYGRLDTGYSWSSDADGSGIVGIGLGYQLNDHIRGDVTLAYRGWYDASKSGFFPGFGTLSGSSDVDSTDGMVNAYYDIGHFDRFTPYVGGGVGVAYNHAGAANLALNGINGGQIGSGNNTDFAWQLSAGTAVSLMQGLSLDIGYRYIDLGKAQTSDTFTAINGATASGARESVNLRGSELQAGLRLAF